MNAEQFDKHLFNLSQQAEDSTVPFNEEAWQRMEQLLDGDKKKRRFALWWWLLPLLLIGGGTAVYLHNNIADNATIVSDNLKSKIEEVETNNQTTKTENKVAEQVVINDTNTLNPSIAKANDNSKVAIKETVPAVTKSTANNASFKTATDKKLVARANTTDQRKSRNDNHQPTILDNTTAQNVQLSTQQDASNSNASIVDGATTKNIDNPTTNADVKPAEIVNSTDKKEVKNSVDTAAKLAVITQQDNPKKKTSFLSKFEISAFAAADITSSNLSLKDPKSLTFGIGLSYQITKKLSIATGFGVSRKLYSADSADYKNQPWVAAAYKLKTVDANCLVYELPINLQYQFAQSKKATWLAIGGVSTYFMKSESYDYNYLYYNMPRKSNYLIEDKNNHLLSILNLAVGYRRQLGKQLSYQLTPFLKIPLTGIGEGKVNLYSAGLQLSLNLKGK
jgi:hypothetical protein